MSEKSTPMTEKEKLEFILWSIDRHDQLRSTTASRAAMVISANALLLAGTTFLLDQAMKAAVISLNMTIFVVSMIVTLVFIVFSIVAAANTVVFVWKRTKKAVGIKDLPNTKFFHASEVVDTFKDKGFSEYVNTFQGTSREDMIKNALGELMQVTFVHNIRYKSLRTSIRFFLVALIPFAFCFLVIVLSLF